VVQATCLESLSLGHRVFPWTDNSQEQTLPALRYVRKSRLKRLDMEYAHMEFQDICTFLPGVLDSMVRLKVKDTMNTRLFTALNASPLLETLSFNSSYAMKDKDIQALFALERNSRQRWKTFAFNISQLSPAAIKLLSSLKPRNIFPHCNGTKKGIIRCRDKH